MKRTIFIFLIAMLVTAPGWSQTQEEKSLKVIEYSTPKKYEIGGITVSGIQYLSKSVLANVSGLAVGEIIDVPGSKISEAMEKLWEQKLFSDIQITVTKIIDEKVFLDIYLQEQPRLSRFSFSGVNKTEADDLRDKVKLVRGSQVTSNLMSRTERIIKDHFISKGYLNTEVIIKQKEDSVMQNSSVLDIQVSKNDRVKIREIVFEGVSVIPEKKLRRVMKETKQKTWYNIFKTSKYIESNVEDDLDNILIKYNELGYRDARILNDSLYKNDDGTIGMVISVLEGKQYFFRDISWVGNTKYSSERLTEFLMIERGDIFDQTLLDDRLVMAPDAVNNAYLNEGYLFYRSTPVEVNIEGDSIDLEIRIYEGPQARINNITITGNDRTNEHVIRREIRSKPGELFNRSEVMRSVRELAQLGFFDPESINPIPVPDPENGTVDIEYQLVERANDQIEISGGWGAGMVIGTLGVRFGNFSARNLFNKDAWRPLPSGDGQNLSLRAQSNGKYYQSYSASFVEPWLGGRKPNSLSVSLYRTVQTNGRQVEDPSRQAMQITGASVGLGRRLSWPDDFFTLFNQLSYQRYKLEDWSYFVIKNGMSNNLSFTTTLGRNSTDQIIYPRRGSNFSAALQITPPYSKLNGKDYSIMSQEDRFRWIEYHKWTFKASWYTKLWTIGEDKDFVLATKAEFGYLGFYDTDARSPFEGFEVGGDGMMGYSYYGRDVISMRGYANGSVTPDKGANLYDKFTMELRFPISLDPNATLFALAFVEAGNAWYEFKDFNPFNMVRSAGVGVRIFLPMFGMMGVDWGYGFDELSHSPGQGGSQFHFVLGPQL
ncbi:MAG: outer membrane protein assembly factor BamA [Bacteroidetes bacterium]|nr:outer membrane protein assembly factor BamA [Bacteroidota bacterium]MBT3751637.1 outer membrane protein assembly factor BamA [Bacteroidota bacterium]MBT4399464.1 outer membrane protein assembly factor BamA [Bacteroidota bacterium]MBT4409996.1 outer membrane protein assembly factor BamA [Bacteroidota bacterium]MBT7463220.1 outer membrane protein assembly factor BamA [Bacteroidota bacterium]